MLPWFIQTVGKALKMTVIQWWSLEKLWCECVRKTRLDWKRVSG